MKKLIFLFAIVFALFSIVKAQTPPNAFNYSAVARNTDGQPIALKTISIQISILKTSPTGEPKYIENHRVTTDQYGLFNLIIGKGSIQSGSITTIDWSNDNYYVKVGMDINGGNNFLTMGTTQLLSVPYALYAKSAGNIVSNNLVLPAVITKEVTNITSNSATYGGEVVNINGNQIIEHGIVYSTSSNPTIISKKVVIFNGITSFDTTTSMKYTDPHFLQADTKYFVRAYVITENGICLYGNEVVFSTLSIKSPLVTTNVVSDITSNTAYFSGFLQSTNGNELIEKGFVLSTDPNPTVSSTKLISITADSNGIFINGIFDRKSGIDEALFSDYLLTPNTKYFVRSYIITQNNNVTYGNEITFNTLPIGQIGTGGGLVFYNKGDTLGGWQYLEATSIDQNKGIPWGCAGTNIDGLEWHIGHGLANTKLILKFCKNDTIAAKLCDDLVTGGKSDWFLPSLNELYLMYKNLHVKGIGDFYGVYWSSSARSADAAIGLIFENGNWNFMYSKDQTASVRAIRAY